MPTCAETIREISRRHLKENGGVLLGQCLTAVGWVGGTVPELTENDGIIELSMADVMGGGIAVGLALAGRRPIYVVRYQGFQWFNASIILNYAAKSKEMWGVPCPIFIRSIGMDGGMGPVASGSHHGIYVRMPGVPICAPMSPEEYKAAWEFFMTHTDPLYVSEHRRSFSIDYELKPIMHEKADITLFPISSTRLNAREALKLLEKEGITANIIDLFWLKPCTVSNAIKNALENSRYGGIVIDGDYENGLAKSIAYDFMHGTKKPICALGLKEKAAGFAPWCDNLPPTAEAIHERVMKIIRSQV